MKIEGKQWSYVIEKTYTKIWKDQDFKIVDKFEAYSLEHFFQVYRKTHKAYKNELKIINSGYLQLLSKIEAEEESKAEIRLFLVEEDAEGQKKHQLFETNSELPIENTIEIENKLYQNLEKRMAKESIPDQSPVVRSPPISYQVKWHSLDFQKEFNRDFIHQNLLNSRSRALSFFRDKAHRGHEASLLVINESDAEKTICLSTTFWQLVFLVPVGRLEEFQFLRELGYEHPDPEYSQLIVPDQDLDGDRSDT